MNRSSACAMTSTRALPTPTTSYSASECRFGWFTLAADTSGGLRPSFSRAAPPDAGARLFDALVGAVASTGVAHACGRFGADMQVTLTNDGPVTFWLQV